MMPKVYIPSDSAVSSIGGDEVARLISDEAKLRNLEIEIIRNGTRGALWLETLVEVESAQGRIAYGPVNPIDVVTLFESGFLDGGVHPLSLGKTEELLWFAGQDRITFSRVGIANPYDFPRYEELGGVAGLRKAIAMSSAEIIAEVTESGLRGRGGAGFPAGIKWRTVSQTAAPQKYICANADEGDSGTFADRIHSFLIRKVPPCDLR